MENRAPDIVVPPDLQELVESGGFRDRAAARRRLRDLFRDTGEMLALARISGTLKDALGSSPDPDAGLLHLTRLVEVRGGRLPLYRSFLDHPALLDRLVHVVASSRYLADVLVRNPDYLYLLDEAALLSRPRTLEELRSELARICAAFRPVEEKLDAMRRFHRREVLRIGASDLLGFQEVPEVTRQVSDLADAFVGECLSIVGGRPERAGLIVLALGKWGGRELNYSSDIDVVFLTDRAARLPAATGLARRLLQALGEPTYEGVVYRVDLRLRPYGSEGALVLTTRMFEDYLRRKARPAERQAMLKARAVAGDLAAGRRFLKRAAPIVLADGPSARREVRKLKARIEKQLGERGQKEGHVKLAPGGIRDVEFLVQALQLETGAPGANTLEALGRLESAGTLSRDDAAALREAYVFLRAVEHRMQLMENQQVYRLPRRAEDLAHLARTLGFRDPHADDRLLDAYDARTRKVRALFDRVLRPPGPAGPAADEAKVAAVRRQLGPAADRLDPDLAAELLEAVRRPGDVAVRAVRNEGRRWTVAVAAAGQAGLLPLLAGRLAARRVNIVSGDFVKLKLEERRRALCVLEVTAPEEVSAAFWDSFRAGLSELAALRARGKDEAARDRIIDEVGETLRSAARSEAPLLPVRVEIRNAPRARETEVHIHSPDTLGFLFEFAAALSALNVDVERAVIRTLDDEVYDTFWVTDLQGRKIVSRRALDELRATAALVKQFMHLLPRAPNPPQALRQFTALLGQILRRPRWLRELRSLGSASVLTTVAEFLGVSRFLWEDFLLLQHENLFPVVVDLPALGRRKSRAQLGRDLARALGAARNEADAEARLNEFKDREMFRTDLRHITRRGTFEEFMASLSDLAEAVVERAAALAVERLRERYGAPVRSDGRRCPWAVGALGKFGGRELGLASDLDLVFVYEEEGRTSGPNPVSNSAFFVEVVQSLLRMLKARREGSFGIDLRLRPYGDSGALASSFDAFERYYSAPGPARQFERMSLVKLAPVAGDASLGARLIGLRDGYVYSGAPLDYENILHLRRRQAAELVPPGEVDAKYSAGGLVDVEYFVQARQIEAGHKDRTVRAPNTLEAVARLVAGGHLRPELGTELSATYVFLRRLIDALRVVRGNARDSRLPRPDVREFAYLARRLDYGSPARLEAELRQRTGFARNLWGEVKFGGG